MGSGEELYQRSVSRIEPFPFCVSTIHARVFFLAQGKIQYFVKILNFTYFRLGGSKLYSNMENKENEESSSKEDLAQITATLTANMKEIAENSLKELLPQIIQQASNAISVARTEHNYPDLTVDHDEEIGRVPEADKLSIFDSSSYDLSALTPPGTKRPRTDGSVTPTASSNSSMASMGSNHHPVMGSNHSNSSGSNRSQHSMGSNHAKSVGFNHLNEEQSLNMSEEILQRCEEEYQLNVDYAPSIDQGIADRVLKYFKTGCESSEIRKAVILKNKIAENLQELDTPKLHPGVKDLKSMSKHTKDEEAKLYNIQNMILKACMAVVKAITLVLQKENANQVVDSTAIVKTCLEAVSLLGYTSKEMSNKRKRNIQYSLDPQLRAMCAPEHPVTKFLLGDDLSKGIKDAREVAKLERKSNNRSGHQSNSKTTAHSSSSKEQYQRRSSGNNSNSGKSFLSKAKRPNNKK